MITMPREQAPDWIIELIEQATSRAGNAANLAKQLKISPGNFVNYQSGTTPTVKVLDKLISYMGGDIRRALPSFDDQGEKRTPKMMVYGQVHAGTVEEGGQFQYEVDGISEGAWKANSLWQKTHGKTILLEIFGDSMSPDYHEGDLIVCREPSNPHELPDGTPCVFRESRGSTFKVLRWTSDKRSVVGMPLNPLHKPIVFKDSEDFRIRYVVLGKVNFGNAVKPRVMKG